MILIYPPLTKPAEPPAGIAQLSGTLSAHGHNCKTIDLNLAGILHILEKAEGAADIWTRRAKKNLAKNLLSIRSNILFSQPAKYQQTVLELNRLLESYARNGAILGLANYQDGELSPLQSDDLLHIAKNPEKNLFYDFYATDLPSILAERESQYIGISINYLSQAINAFALIGFIKRSVPTAKIIIGGGLITSWMRGPLWNNPFAGLVDLCIDGCGQKPLLNILGTQQFKRSLPNYSSFGKLDYFSPGFVLPYSSSTGCYWNKCSFCPERAEGNSFAMQPSRQISAEIKLLVKTYSPVLLHFLDNAIPPVVLSQLIKHDPGIPWYGFARITDDFLEMDYCIGLRRSGCTMLKLGVESGDQTVLDKMEKGLRVVTIAKVLQNLTAAGIATYVYLLFGTPAETINEARTTLEFTRKYSQNINFLNLAIFNMPINSDERKDLQTSEFYSGDLSLYTDFQHPHGWTRKKVRKFLAHEFKKHPDIHTILKRDPVIFTSNHAPFFCRAFRLKK